MSKPNDMQRIAIRDLIFYQLLKENIIAKVSTRLKDPISSLNKMLRDGRSIEGLYDLVGARIIIDTERDCYRSLYVLKSLYQCDFITIKDYIQTPKLNGYQSLHIIVLNLFNGCKVEVQIRTSMMHITAENGAASHKKYKQEQQDQITRAIFDNITIKQSLNKARNIHQDFNWTIQEIIAYKKEIKNLSKYFTQ